MTTTCLEILIGTNFTMYTFLNFTANNDDEKVLGSFNLCIETDDC